MNKILSFKKIVFVGFFVAFMAVFLSVGTVKAETTYKWVNNGSVLKSDSRKTGDCSTKKQVTTYTCSSSTKGNKLYDGANKGSSYGDIGNAWPIYGGENTSTATEYTFDGCSQDTHNTSGTVNEWECKSSDSTANSSSSSSSSNSSSSASSVSKPTVTTGAATNITSNSATISATINNGGASSAQAVIYYMKSNGSSWTLAGNKTLSGSGDQDISADITGLSSGTKYYYRAKAQNSAGVNFGSQKTFTTSSGSSSSVSSGASSSSSSVQQYTLKVKISGAGKITSSGGSGVINCKKSIDSKGKSETSGDCSVKFNKGESVTLTVSTPSTKYEFATWADACRGSQKLSSCTIVMNGDKTVSATFNKKVGSSENTVTVSIRKTGSGVGKVVSIGAGKNKGKIIGGIDCGSNCSESYPLNSEGYIYLKATPEKGSTFGGWGEDCSSYGTKDTCTVTLGGDKTLVTAKFNEGKNNAEGKNFNLTVTVSEGGKVATTDNKISCDSSSSPCKHSYGKNGTVTLKATPNSGYSLKPSISNWGSCDKMITGNNSCQIKMTKNRNVSVKFTKTSSSSSSSSSSSTSAKTSSSSASANHTATTSSVTNITSTSATLNGTVNPEGENVYYIFSYGKKGVSDSSSSAATKNTSWKSAGSGSSDVSASADISGLSSGTTYYYWISAYSYTKKTYVNSLNGDNGAAKTFTTSGGSSSSSSSSSLSSSSSSSSQTTSSTYKLKVTVSGNGRIQDNYSKIDCGSNMACQATYSKGQVIRILTNDINGSGDSFGTKVDSWSGGDCSGTGNSCEITMDGDKEVTVKFVSK